MKLPNWQHHSKKEAKRTLKPQALRQAKKRRSALKAKLLAASVLLVGFASPAQAITWNDFWEPFDHDHRIEVHHYHDRPQYIRPTTCIKEVRQTRWVPGRWRGDVYIYGHYKEVVRDRRVPCRRLDW